MAWTVEILGMSGAEHWSVSDLPPLAEDQDRVVQERFPDVRLECENRRGTHLRYVARPPRARRRMRGPELSLVATGGPDAGHIVPLPRDGTTVGRGGSRWRLADPSAPGRPVRVRPSSAGIAVDDDGPCPWNDEARAVVGATELMVARGPGAPLPAPSTPPPARVDTSGAPAPMSMVLPVVMAVGPLLLGVVLAVTTGRAFFLFFGLLSVVAVATMLGLQRRSRTRFRRRLAARVDDIVEARRRAAPTPRHLSMACRAVASDRFALQGGVASSHGTDDFPPLVLCWGTARGEMPLDDPVRQERWRADTVRRQPALSTLSPGRSVTVRTAGQDHEGAVRWLLLQLLCQTTRHGLGLVVQAEDTGDQWRVGATAAGVVLAVPSARLVAPIRRAWTRYSAAMADDGPPTPDRDRWAAVSVSSEQGSSDLDGDVIDLGGGTVLLTSSGQSLEDLVPHEVSARTSAWWAAEIASDASAAAHEHGHDAAPTPLRLPAAPGRASAVETLRAPLAGTRETDAPTFGIDLVGDGPHVLIAGTTGSGKSDLLLSLLTGLCAVHPPADVALVLLDFKGGASFSCLEQLPHTMSVETNHVAAASLRAFDAISAELRRREELFAAHRVSDYPSFRRAQPDAVLPRLVVAVDELRVLLDDHPDASEVLRRLAATGRSLGFHLVLAAQRATGTVTSDIRSNLGSVLCLRTATEQESWDLTGSAIAARIPSDRPGTVVHVRQGHEPVLFRAATWIGADAPALWTRRGQGDVDRVAPTLWGEVVHELAALSRAGDPVLPRPILSPPLPETWRPVSGSPSPLALLDDTAAGRHRPLRWESGHEGSTAWIIEDGGGRGPLLCRLRSDLVTAGERVVHLYGSGAPGDEAPAWTSVPADGGSDLVARALAAVDDLAEAGGTLLITGWSAWSALRCPSSYRGFEELLLGRLGADSGRRVRVAAVGGRELASSRLLGELPRRLYVPGGTTPEQRMMWPRLTEVLHSPGRAVLVDAEHPEPGVPAQLAFPGP